MGDRQLRHAAEYGAYLLVARLFRYLPYPTLVVLGELLGALFHRVARTRVALARNNVRNANLGLSESEIRELVKVNFRHFGSLFIATLHLMEAEPEELRRWVHLEGLEHYRAASSQGIGFIQVTGHYGNWEAVALIQSLEGAPVAAIGRSLDNPFLDAELVRYRTRFGNRSVPKAGAMREVVKALRAGEGIGFLLDQDAITMEVFVRFLGQWASTYLTAGQLAVKYRLPILPVFSWPEADGSITVRFEAPFSAPSTGDADRDSWTATQLMVARIEAQIRKDPRWWFWMHNRFKTQPYISSAVALPPPEWSRPFHPGPPAPGSGA